MTGTWTVGELERIGAAEELQIAPLGADGQPRRTVPIWGGQAARVRAGGVERDVELVEAGDDVDVAVDAAYREKYGRYPSYVEPMVRAEAQATTMRLLPHR